MAAIPIPTDKYDAAAEQRRNQVMETELSNRLERFKDIYAATNRYILTSPDGTEFILSVDDDGNIIAEGVTPAPPAEAGGDVTTVLDETFSAVANHLANFDLTPYSRADIEISGVVPSLDQSALAVQLETGGVLRAGAEYFGRRNLFDSGNDTNTSYRDPFNTPATSAILTGLNGANSLPNTSESNQFLLTILNPAEFGGRRVPINFNGAYRDNAGFAIYGYMDGMFVLDRVDLAALLTGVNILIGQGTMTGRVVVRGYT